MRDQRADEPIDVFVSYSGADRDLVAPFVLLLRLQGSRVFWAGDSISPGTRWAAKVRRALDTAETVIVFWCCHAPVSKWILHEIRQSHRLNKFLVPTRICGAPMPFELESLQWIAFDSFVEHECLSEHPAPAPDPDSDPEDLFTLLPKSELERTEVYRERYLEIADEAMSAAGIERAGQPPERLQSFAAPLVIVAFVAAPMIEASIHWVWVVLATLVAMVGAYGLMHWISRDAAVLKLDVPMWLTPREADGALEMHWLAKPDRLDSALRIALDLHGVVSRGEGG